MIKTGFETLTEAGYAPNGLLRMPAEMKLIVDLIYEGGIANMNYSISNNAEYGEYVTGVEVINDKIPRSHAQRPQTHQTGEYAKMFIQEGAVNYASMTARRRLTADHQIEKSRRSTAFYDALDCQKNKLVDQDKTNLSFNQIKPA